jgi:hypothetical protein
MTLSYLEQIKQRILNFNYPCHIIVYGSERTYRTTYRSEHPGCFAEKYCETYDDAASFIYDINWQGCVDELTIYATENHANLIEG